MKPLVAAALALFALPTLASAQIIVNTGDDREAIVNNAPSGSVIEIQSDATFTVTLKFGYTWTKDMTLQAGAGFTPTLKGTTGAPIKITCDNMKLNFTGLMIEGASTNGNALKIVKGPTPNLQVVVTDCLVTGDLSIETATGSDAAVDLESSEVTGEIVFNGSNTGDIILVMRHSEGTIANHTGPNHPSIQALIEDSVLNGPVIDYGLSPGSIWQVRRTRINGGVVVDGNQVPTQHELTFESCLLKGSGLIFSAGLDAFATTTKLNVINCTVTGFNTGARLGGSCTVTNSIIDGNSGVDVLIESGISPSVITHSLIGNWNYPHNNGNVSGPALLDTDWSLMPGSNGIDAGDNASVGTLLFDFYGNPRVQDMDGDGVATVSMGAIESPSPDKATIVVNNGSGTNPLDFSGTVPVLGTVFHGTIQKLPTTFLTVMAIDSPSVVPFVVPGWTGEVLVAASPILLIDFAFGDHVVPLPLDPALIGGVISAQGARLDLNGAVTETVLLNRLDLTLGI